MLTVIVASNFFTGELSDVDACMNHFQTVEEFVAQSKSAATIDELADYFQQAISQFGFEFFALSPCSGFDNISENAFVVDRFPKAWTSRYMDQRYYEYDPTFDVASREQLPFTWHSCADREGLTRMQRQIFVEASEAGLRCGLSVPIHVWDRPSAVVSVAGRNLKIDTATRSAVHLMAMYLYQAVARILGGAEDLVSQNDRLLKSGNLKLL